uniref:Amphiphysin-like n=1 Tax=Sinocyclocheilus grahami TaxID=75366 RepID=A0A672NB93_SINGR
MAEVKTGIFAKNVQKRLSRAQEKVLQKLGKADETKDEQFEQCVQNFKRQEFEGSRLQREMKAYIAAVKGMQQASRNLTESLHEVYESDWHGKDDVMIIGKNCDVLWEDFHQKLVDSTINTLETYLIQFPDLKIRVAKRSRKLIDYDSARHHLETLQASTMRNEKKTAKAEEDLKKAQRVFDDLNVDLQDELPTLWDSRVGFYVSTFQNVSSLEARFHREISFLCHKLYEVMNKLAEQHSDKMFTIQGAPSDSGPLRLARTPTPPDDDSSDSSPAASPNHTLRPTSPGPPRPKSPSQLKMGPPKPPPPKATPTKELQQEQIIDLFDGGFPEISVTSPQPNEKPGESLLDLDFDPFKPDGSTPIGQTQSPISQVLLHTLLMLLKIRDSDRSNENFYVLAILFIYIKLINQLGNRALILAYFFLQTLPWDLWAVSLLSLPVLSDLCELMQRREILVLLEKMPIPSVVIEPASSNEGDDDRDGDIISPIATSDNGVITECQTTKDISSGMPPGYLFRVNINLATRRTNSYAVLQVEMMHDFEAANPDELELKKGDIVLVVPTELAEDQDAGWLTGIRESDWLQLGTSAQKGLFPENFMQRLE